MPTRVRDRQIRDGRVLLQTINASSTATIDFTGLASLYQRYEIQVDNLVVATNGTSLRCRVSTDNGSTWKSGATDYSYTSRHAAGGATSVSVVTSSGNTFIQLTPALLVTTANCVMDGRFWVLSPATSARFAVVMGDYVINGAVVDGGSATGQYQTAGAINGIRLFASSGNIATGQFRLYGHP